MALQLNQELQNKYPHLEVSVLKYSDAMKDNDSKRIDSEFFKKEYLYIENKIKKKKFIQLKDTDITIKHPAEIERNYVDNGIWFFRTQNLRPLRIEEDTNRVFISNTDAEKLSKNIIARNDILITRTGANCGDCAIYDLSDLAIASSHILVIRNTFFNQSFLSVFLNTKFGKLQINKGIYGGLQPEIAPYYLKNIYVPIFSNEFQQQIEQMVCESHACLEQSKDLYREAEVLLYRELGLDPENPLASIEPHSGSLNISVRPLSQSLNTTGRLDSEYYQQKYDEIEKVIKKQKFAKLSDLVNMQKSIEPGSEAYQENGIPFIRVSNFNKFGISDTDIFLDFSEFSQTIKPKKETILLSKDGSIGMAYCVKDDGNFITSSALLHLNIKREKQREILPEYLTLILNSILVKLQAERDSGGSIIAHWRISEIEQILIPILDISIQEKIENLIKQSFTLRQKANELLQTAKQSVENAIEKG